MRTLLLTFIGLLLILAPRASAQTAPALTLTHPSAYQVFQRSAGYGLIRVTGAIQPAGDYTLTVFLSGTTTLLNSYAVSATFDEWILAPQGQYTVTVDAGGAQAVIERVGVGDIFVVAGQSNAMGYGLNNQAYTHPTLTASLFNTGYQWAELADPTDRHIRGGDAISADSLARGSVWPLLATLIMADQNVPVAFIPTARGGSSIVAWIPHPTVYRRGTLFGAMMNRVEATGGNVRALLWWQGETNARQRWSAEQYGGHLRQIVTEWHDLTDAPVFAALLQQFTYAAPAYTENLRRGVRALAADLQYVYTVDLTALAADDTAHLRTDEKLAQAAAAWWTALDAALYG